jgi:D-alanyl-D-alanine carboxypeptidase
VVALVAIASLAGLLAVAWPRQDALEPALTGSARRATSSPDAPKPDAGSGGGSVGEPVRSPTATESVADEPYVAPPAWLAWISGGFDPSFRATSASLPGFRATVIVAGDTLWLTGSASSDGRVLDEPRPPYRIPIDAFAVDPVEYEPFVGTGVRELVVRTLRRGHAVLGASSAELRRIDVGGTLDFGGATITVGAIVPDDAVGWSEVMVNRSVGRSLGITHDRYLLGLTGNTSLTEPGFEARVAKLLPAGTSIRVDAPGSTPYVRVASGVRPAVVMKQVFGEFSARVASDGVTLELDPRWVDEHIVTRTVPLLGEVTCHRKLFPPLLAALEHLESRGLGSLVEVYSGCWVARTVARSSTAPPSYHSYGAAIDINAPSNPYGEPPTMDPRLVEAFESQGFNWGGDFLIPDGHHFEYWGPPGDGAPR